MTPYACIDSAPERGVDQLLYTLFLAVEDAVVELLLDGHALLGIGSRIRFVRRDAFEVGNEVGQRLWCGVEDQRLRHLALVGGDLGVRFDVRRVDDRQVQPCLHGMVEEDRVKHRACVALQAEGEVGNAQDGVDAG